MADNINELIDNAMTGNKKSLENIIKIIQDKIYNLALRMLWNPLDAEDATQEILIRIITNLSSFRKDCKFTTWIYKISANYLLTLRKKNNIEQNISFEILKNGLLSGYSDTTAETSIDRNLLIQEIKIGCTHAMLLCLERDYRLIFILGNIFRINSNDAAEIIGTTPETFRKRLSRARKKIKNFMEENCGIANSNNKCKCEKQIQMIINNNRKSSKELLFADKEEVGIVLREMDELGTISTIFQTNPYYRTPQNVINEIIRIINSNEYNVIKN